MYKVQRQYDIPLTNMFFATLPADAPGRTTRDDYVYFDFYFDPTPYDVVAESFSGEFLKFSPLAATVKLPHVHFGKGSLLLVMPRTNPALPTFVGTMCRGHRYALTTTNMKNGNYVMN